MCSKKTKRKVLVSILAMIVSFTMCFGSTMLVFAEEEDATESVTLQEEDAIDSESEAVQVEEEAVVEDIEATVDETTENEVTESDAPKKEDEEGNALEEMAQEPYLKLTMTTPVAGEAPTLEKYTKVIKDTNTIMGDESRVETTEGSWKLNGSTFSKFEKGKTYTYTIVITVSGMGGFAQSVLQSKPQIIGCYLSGVKTSLSSGDQKLTVIGTYTIPDMAEITNISNVTSDFSYKSHVKEAVLKVTVDQKEKVTGYDVYSDGVYVSTYVLGPTMNYNATNYLFVKIGYQSPQQVHLVPYYVSGGTKVYGNPSPTVTCYPDQIVTGGMKATKITADKVRITWGRTTGASGYYIYAGSSKIATITNPSTCLYQCSRKGAARLVYSVQAYYKDNTGVYPANKRSAGVSANMWYSSFSPAPGYYGYTLKNYVNMNKVWYTKANSKGKLKATFTITNTWQFAKTKKAKVKITVYSQGKKVASQSFTVKKIPLWGKKAYTVKFKKAKAGYDLTNAGGCRIVTTIKASH